MKTLKDKIVVGIALGVTVTSLCTLVYFLAPPKADAATLRVQGATVEEQMLREVQAQTKLMERMARALEEVAKR